ncbi:MAG TPA: thiamine ABC transporter substrate-binding protein [Anaerolineaceae bacterium]|nr:thiamine ABC transporter substrate-binding protein [Anaerolineaceae bacterium]
MIKRSLIFGALVALLLGGCVSQTPAASPTPVPEAQVLTVMTHDSFAVSAELVQQFEAENNVKVNFIKGGDAGTTLNRLILTSLGGTPEADVFYGLDNTFLSRALEQDLLEAYDAPALAQIPAEFQLDPSRRALPVDYGDVCINYDKAWFQEHQLPVPQSLEDLTKPEYYGLLVVENPATSSPGLSFLLATISSFGEDGWQSYWQALKENGVVVVSDWETAYYTNFSGSSGRGPQPLVVSYASSPAAELIYAETPLSEAPTGSIIADGACWRQVEFAGILKGTPNRALAEKFIDFMLSQPFQEDMPLQMFVYPVLPSAKLPEAFVKASEVPQKPATLDPELIVQKRELWVQAWTELMLK